MPRFRDYTLLTSFALSTVLSVSSLGAGDGDWPSFRGPAGSGQALAAPAGEGALSMSLRWKRSLGSGYSGVSIQGGLLVTGMAGDESDFVVALDASTGEERWRYVLDAHHAGHDGGHDGPISTPAIADGRVFMVSPEGRWVALDLDSGEELWAQHLVEDVGGEKSLYDFGGSPAVIGDVVVLNTGGEQGLVAGFDVASGDIRWRAFPESGSAPLSSPIAAEIDGVLQALILGPGWAAGLDAASGETLWRFDLEERGGAMGSYSQSPVPIGDGRIFIKHEQGRSHVIQVTRTDSGWEATMVTDSRGLARSYSPVALAGERLFGYTARFLSAIEPENGELLWRSREPGDGFLLSVEDQLAVLTKTGSVHLGAADSSGWQESGRLDLFEDLAWTPPSYADGALYLRSLGEIARVDLVRTGAPMMVATEVALPEVLSGLAADLETGEDGAAVLDGFLGGRELPLIDGEQVVFLWRGEADDVAVAGEMIGMRREEPMNRLEGTDLWWWACELGRQARISYVFIVDDELRLDPSHERVATSTILGTDMNWNRGEPFDWSWFAMPEWPGLESPHAMPVEAGGRLDMIEVSFQPAAREGEEAPEPVLVPVHVWLPPGYDAAETRYPTVYVHHGAAREVGGWPASLDRVVGATVEPLIAVFPDTAGLGRLRGFAEGELVSAIDARFRTRADRDSRAAVGMGWDGLGATLITFGNSDVFGALGVQSLFLLEEEMRAVESAIGDADASTLSMNIYLEYGRWDLVSPHEEMNMRRSSRWAWDLFRSKGWEPIGGEVWDSTDFASWSNRTGLLLQALFPLEGAGDQLARWQTGE